MKTKNHSRTGSPVPWRKAVHLCLLGWAVLGAPRWAGAAEPSLTDKAKEALHDATEAVQDAGEAAAKSLEDWWRRVDEKRLKNRTFDEMVAWVLMGALVGSVAGMMTTFKPTGLGKAGRLLLGLAGAFIGGMAVHLARLDFGWGPVLIRYEDLLFSLLGAVVLIVVGRLLRSRTNKPRSGTR